MFEFLIFSGFAGIGGMLVILGYLWALLGIKSGKISSLTTEPRPTCHYCGGLLSPVSLIPCNRCESEAAQADRVCLDCCVFRATDPVYYRNKPAAKGAMVEEV